MVERVVDGGDHVVRLRESDDRTVGWVDGDFGLVAVLLDGENHLGFESVAKDFADFIESSFNFLADGGRNFVLTAGVLHVHGTTSTKIEVRGKRSEVRGKIPRLRDVA